MNYTSILLITTGLITFLPGILFFFPIPFLNKILKIKVNDDIQLFFIRHWGLLVAVLGALIIFTAFNESILITILIVAVIEKAALVFLVYINRKKDFIRGLIPVALFDSICVILYLIEIILR